MATSKLADISSNGRKWRLRPRLLLLIALPTGAALALGGVSIAGSWQSAAADQRSEALAGLSAKITQLAFQVEAERDAIVWYIANGVNGRASQLNRHANPTHKVASEDRLQIVQQQFRFTAPWLRAVATGVTEVGSGYPPGVQGAARAVAAKLRNLPSLRDLALRSQIAAPDVLGDYDNLLGVLLSFDDQLPLKSDDPQLISTTRAMAAISRYESEEAVQRAIVMYGLTARSVSSGLLTEFNASVANQEADSAEFENFATASQLTMFNQSLAASLEDRVVADEEEFSQNADRLAGVTIVPQDWYGAESDTIAVTHKYEETLANSIIERARVLHDRAVTSALVVGGILAAVLVFSLLLAMYVGRFMPERRRPATVLGLSPSS
jgi:outer membrane murein-binding lipoprotein Lpp